MPSFDLHFFLFGKKKVGQGMARHWNRRSEEEDLFFVFFFIFEFSFGDVLLAWAGMRSVSKH